MKNNRLFQVIVLFFGSADQIERMFIDFRVCHCTVAPRVKKQQCLKKTKTFHRTQYHFRKDDMISQNILENTLFQKTFTKRQQHFKKPTGSTFSVTVFLTPRATVPWIISIISA